MTTAPAIGEGGVSKTRGLLVSPGPPLRPIILPAAVWPSADITGLVTWLCAAGWGDSDTRGFLGLLPADLERLLGRSRAITDSRGKTTASARELVSGLSSSWEAIWTFTGAAVEGEAKLPLSAGLRGIWIPGSLVLVWPSADITGLVTCLSAAGWGDSGSRGFLWLLTAVSSIPLSPRRLLPLSGSSAGIP